MTLLDWTWFGHNFGIGISWDWTLLWHVLIYGGTVWVFAFITNGYPHNPLFYASRLGLSVSLTAAFYLEILQMWQYHWGCGMGDPLDLAVSWGAAYVVYRRLRYGI